MAAVAPTHSFPAPVQPERACLLSRRNCNGPGSHSDKASYGCLLVPEPTSEVRGQQQCLMLNKDVFWWTGETTNVHYRLWGKASKSCQSGAQIALAQSLALCSSQEILSCCIKIWDY